MLAAPALLGPHFAGPIFGSALVWICEQGEVAGSDRPKCPLTQCLLGADGNWPRSLEWILLQPIARRGRYKQIGWPVYSNLVAFESGANLLIQK